MHSVFLPRASETDLKPDPAFARWGSGYGDGYGQRIEREFGRLECSIIIAADRGEISSREERRLLHRLAAIDRLYDRCRWKALSHRERKAIVEHLRLIRSEIRHGGIRRNCC